MAKATENASKGKGKGKAPAASKTETEEKKPKRTLVSYKDTGMAFLLRGVAGVKALHQKSLDKGSDGISEDTLWKAYDSLAEAEDDCPRPIAELSDFIVEKHGERGASTGTRGRGAPAVGDSRVYKAQQLFKTDEETKEKVANGDPFIRLSLGALGITKGEKVSVQWNDGNIIIMPYTGEEDGEEAGE